VASPAAILSILVEANTNMAAGRLRAMQGQLEATGAVVTEFEGKARGMSGTLGHVGGAAEKSRGGLLQFAKGAAAAFAAFKGFEAAKDAISSTVDLGKATLKLQAITGADATTASKWIELMKLRGLSGRAVGVSFITLSRNMRNAEHGSKTARTAFAQLGISQDQLKRTNPTEMISLVAEGLHKIHDPANRAALAQQLFGRGAQALLPVLAGGKKGVEENLAAIQKYGAYLPKNTKSIKGAIEASHGWELAQEGLKIKFATAVLPILVKVGNKVLDFIAQMRSGKGAGGDFARILSHAFTALKKAAMPTITWLIAALKNVVAWVKQNWPEIKSTFLTVWNAIQAASRRAGIIVKAVMGAVISVARSVVNWFKAHWPAIRGVVVSVFHAIRNVVRAVFPVGRSIVVGVFNAIKTAVRILVAVWKVAWAAMKVPLRILENVIKIMWHRVVHPIFNSIKGVITKVLIPAFNAIKGPVRTVAKIVGQAFNGMKKVVGTVIDFILGAVSTFIHGLGSIANAASKIPVVGDLFDGVAGKVNNAADAVDHLRGTLKDALKGGGGGIPKGIPSAADVNAAAGIVPRHLNTHGHRLSRHPAFATHHAVRHAARQVADAAAGPEHHHHRHRAATKAGEAAGKAAGKAASKGAAAAGTAAGKAAGAAVAAALPSWLARLAVIPSQGIGGQVRMQQLQNQAAVAQNAGNTAGENRATRSELKLEKQWLASDNSQLRKINQALKRRGLTRKQRAALIADKLALLQEIGTIVGNIGQTSQALADGGTGSGSTGGGGGFDLAPGNVPLPTVYDVRRSVAAHAGAVHHHHHNNQRIHVTVSKTGDERKVIEAIDKTIGSHVHARMRAAGMRGT
jgi:hypothetical protein